MRFTKQMKQAEQQIKQTELNAKKQYMQAIKNLLNKGVDYLIVMECTGATRDEIEAARNNADNIVLV